MASVGSETFTSTSHPIQQAAITAFGENDEIEEYLKNERRILKALGSVLTEKLQKAGAKVKCPEGAFYLFPDFSDFSEGFQKHNIQNSTDMCERLLEDTGVAILPGSDFGRPECEFTARLAYVDFDGEKALEGIKMLPEEQLPGEEYLRKYCGRMLEAIDRICHWVNNIN